MKVAAIACGAIASLFSSIFALYFVVGVQIHVRATSSFGDIPCAVLPSNVGGIEVTLREVTFGMTVNGVKVSGQGSLLASFSLTLLACIFASPAVSLLGKEKFKPALGLLGFSFVLSCLAFVYFVGIKEGSGSFIPCMEWGPGLNIGAVLLYVGAIGFGIAAMKTGGGESTTPMTNIHSVDSRG